LIPEGPLGDKVLREAIYRYAQSVIDGGIDRYRALTDILKRSAPRLASRMPGDAIVAEDADLVTAATDALAMLEDSYLLEHYPSMAIQ